MAIDNTGISSLDAGALDIKYTGDEGPKSPKQIAGGEYNRVLEILEKVRENIPLSDEEKMELQGLIKTLTAKGIDVRQLIGQEQGREGIQMASAADPMLQDEYDKYVFELQEIHPEAVPMSLEQFRQEAVAGMATGGRVGFQGGGRDRDEAPTSKSYGPPGSTSRQAAPTHQPRSRPDPSPYSDPKPATDTAPGDIQFTQFTDTPSTDPHLPPQLGGPSTEQMAAEVLAKQPSQKEKDETVLDTIKEKFVHPVRKLGYNILPNNPRNEFRYIAYLKYNDPEAYAQLPQKLIDLFEATEDPANEFMGYKDFDKFSFDDFESLRTFKPTDGIDFANYAAKYAGAPGLLHAGNVGNLEKIKNADGTYSYREKTGGDDQDRPLWMRLGYGSEQEYINAGGGTTAATTTPATTTATQQAATTYPEGWNPLYHIGGGATQEQINYMENVLGMAPGQTYAAQGGRIGYAGGGITDLRQGYGLGDLVKGITKPFKKLLRSKAGKLGLMALLGMKGPSMLKGMGIGGGDWASLGTSFKKNPMPWITALSGLGYATAEEEENLYGGRDKELDEWNKQFAGLSDYAKPWYGAQGGRTGYKFGERVDMGLEQEVRMRMKIFNEDYDTALEKVLEARAGTVSSPSGTSVMEPGSLGNQLIARTGLYENTPSLASRSSGIMPMARSDVMMPFMAKDNTYMPVKGELPAGVTTPERGPRPLSSSSPFLSVHADGGRIGYAGGGNDEEELPHRKAALAAMYRNGAQEGGLMDLGGMEKDYRQEGGFVPIGGEERADDVPARLSKNEFVFTADAVRAAGGGDIDKGAEIMENVMENLEQGGNISEESQGLEGARDMFATAQRLEGVL